MQNLALEVSVVHLDNLDVFGRERRHGHNAKQKSEISFHNVTFYTEKIQLFATGGYYRIF
jgi:hypothetical protein